MGQGCLGSESAQAQMAKKMRGVPPIDIEYFDLHGRALQLRMLAWYCNVPFKETRITQEEFDRNKKNGKYRFNVVPAVHF